MTESAPDPGYGRTRTLVIIIFVCVSLFLAAWALRLPGGPWEPHKDPSPTPRPTVTQESR